jgi:hypothetical protein
MNGYKKVYRLPKLRLYKNIKRNFRTENYLCMNIPKFQRSLLAQLRCGILPIRIETGRYRGEAVDDRICTMCSLDCIEDEYHFLLHCTDYFNLKSEFFTSIGCNPMPNLDCINFILTHFPRQTVKFIHSAYVYRHSLIYRKRIA